MGMIISLESGLGRTPLCRIAQHAERKETGMQAIAFAKALMVPHNTRWLALAGTGIALFGDVVTFFTGLVNHTTLLIGLTFFAAFMLYLCWRIFVKAPADALPPEQAADCRECNATRFGIFATAALALLAFIGSGESATAKIGEQLGLIQRDVSDIKEILEPQSIIDDPDSAADHFNNAFVYHHYRNDSAKAMESMRTLYRLDAPRKIDAAQLFFDSHTAQQAKSKTLAEMQRLGAEKQDATLLVVAARHAATGEERDRLIAQARSIAPDLPHAWWDPLVMPDAPRDTFTRPGEEAARLRARIANIEKFLALEEQSPPSRWFYMPAMAAGSGSAAQMLLGSYRQQAQQYEDMESGKFQREIRDKIMRDRAKGT